MRMACSPKSGSHFRLDSRDLSARDETLSLRGRSGPTSGSAPINPSSITCKGVTGNHDPYSDTLGHNPVQTWRFYNSRAESENRIKELKEDFGAGGFCLQSFDGYRSRLPPDLLPL